MAVNGYGDLSAYGWGRALLEDEGAGFGDEVSEDALPRYIDPLNDWGFKRLFGTEMNKEFLVAFLMTIFPDKRIKDNTYLPTEQQDALKCLKTWASALRLQTILQLQKVDSWPVTKKCGQSGLTGCSKTKK